MLFQNTISTLPFNQWLLKDAENKRLISFTMIIAVISFCWLKYMYPYPNFMPPDSYSYLEAATENKFINTWPIGYSRFLRLISSFSNSHFLLVTIQYFALIAAVLYFLLTIRYLLSPGKLLFRILLIISISNPLLPHIANFISSDCLFAALSMIWFTQLLWILHHPSKKLLLSHAIILLTAFMVRFMALYYPFFSIGVISIKLIPRNTKLMGIGSITFLLLSFIGCTQYEYKLKTGTIQYSAFGGWQLAANALYGYAYSKPVPIQNVPFKFRELHTLVNQHMDSIRQVKNRPDREVGIYYLWNLKSPLRLYMVQSWKNRPKTPWFKQWASVAPIYQQYGTWLIMQHPLEYTRYYLWPNFLKYYAPPTMFMGSYNLKSKTVWPIAVTWFDWSNDQLPIRTNDRVIHIISIFPTLLSIINPLFLLTVIAFAVLGGLHQCRTISKQVLVLMWLIWLANLGFSVLSAPTELRYQLFPIIITITFCGLFTAWIIQTLQTTPSIKQHRKFIPASETIP